MPVSKARVDLRRPVRKRVFRNRGQLPLPAVPLPALLEPGAAVCHLFGQFRPCRGIVTTVVTPIAATTEVEAVYRQDGARLWRALYAFAGNENVASDAVAEAFAQALARGSAIQTSAPGYGARLSAWPRAT